MSRIEHKENMFIFFQKTTNYPFLFKKRILRILLLEKESKISEDNYRVVSDMKLRI